MWGVSVLRISLSFQSRLNDFDNSAKLWWHSHSNYEYIYIVISKCSYGCFALSEPTAVKELSETSQANFMCWAPSFNMTFPQCPTCANIWCSRAATADSSPLSASVFFLNFKWELNAVVCHYLWRETIAACSFSFSAWVVPSTCQACMKTKEQVRIKSTVETWTLYSL